MRQQLRDNSKMPILWKNTNKFKYILLHSQIVTVVKQNKKHNQKQKQNKKQKQKHNQKQKQNKKQKQKQKQNKKQKQKSNKKN
jgi:hypothetical protein